MEVTNGFKGLDLIERVPEELWTEVCDYCTGGSDKDSPQEKERQKDKMVIWGDLTDNWEKKRREGKGEKERYIHLNAESHKESSNTSVSIRVKSLVFKLSWNLLKCNGIFILIC